MPPDVLKGEKRGLVGEEGFINKIVLQMGSYYRGVVERRAS